MYIFIYFLSLGEWLTIYSFIMLSIHDSIIKFCLLIDWLFYLLIFFPLGSG